MSSLKSIVRRVGIVALASLFALSVTGLSVAAADPSPGQVGVIYNTNSAAYQQTAADVRAQQYLGFYGYGYGYGYGGYGAPFYGYSAPFYGYSAPFYGYNTYAYPAFNTYSYGYTGGAPLYGYALNYNFNFPYSGLPNTYFASANCAVGNYTCLFGNLGTSASLPNSFFDAVGCTQGNYACATDQSVFTSKGCTIGNYACVFSKTGKTP